MDDRCFTAEEAGEILSLPESDPRRRHADTCPRCGSLLDAYRAFMEADAPAGPDWHRLEHDLRARVEDSIGAPVAGASSRRPTPRPAHRVRPGWLDRLLHPAMRPAFALGALAIVVAVTMLVTRDAGPPGIVLRGDAGAFEIGDVERVGDTVHVRWPRVAGADGYRARFFSSALRDIATREAAGDTFLRVPVATLGTMAPGETLLVRIEALAGGDVVETSPPRAFAGD